MTPNAGVAPPPLVIQTEELDAASAAWLAERCELVACPVTDNRFPSLLMRASGLVVRTYTKVDRQLLERAPKLRVVGRAGVGLDRIDVAACREKGVEVVHTPDANSSAVAEYVFALLFDAVRPRLFLDRALDETEWRSLRTELEAPRQLCELTIGILGLGRVGSRIARIAGAFGMRVMYHDIREIPAADRQCAECVSLGAMLEACDVLTVHIDPRPANHRFINAPLLAQLKPGAIVINTSRGVIVDHDALAEFLRRDPDAGAFLDVHDPEPFPPGHPLLGLRNAHLSPHIAAATALAHVNMSWVVRDVWRVLSGETPEFPAP